ncbi:MAG: MATE family efflux transporter, partial [Clostridiales bacterium]|nr:MATE family efflux transporter [Clostridiales bacterium]
VGQNVGAGLSDRIRKGNRFCVVGGSLLIFGLAMLMLINGETILGIFTTDVEVIALGISIMKVTFPFYFLCVMVECFSSNLRGHGQAMVPMIVTVICYCGIRLLVLFYVMGQDASVSDVAITYPISWGIAALRMFAATYVKKPGKKL